MGPASQARGRACPPGITGCDDSRAGPPVTWGERSPGALGAWAAPVAGCDGPPVTATAGPVTEGGRSAGSGSPVAVGDRCQRSGLVRSPAATGKRSKPAARCAATVLRAPARSAGGSPPTLRSPGAPAHRVTGPGPAHRARRAAAGRPSQQVTAAPAGRAARRPVAAGRPQPVDGCPAARAAAVRCPAAAGDGCPRRRCLLPGDTGRTAPAPARRCTALCPAGPAGYAHAPVALHLRVCSCCGACHGSWLATPRAWPAARPTRPCRGGSRPARCPARPR